MTATRYELGDGPLDRSLRVGDKEREAVGDVLRQRHLEGRLDTDELQERLERSMSAKTYAELDALIADFPSERRERRPAERRHGRAPFPRVLLFLPLVLIVAGIAAGHVVWPAFFFLFVFARAGHHRGPWAGGPRRTA